MDDSQIKQLKRVARIMAMSVASSARIEAMKAANAKRQSDGEALAYGEKAFIDVEQELINSVRNNIGL